MKKHYVCILFLLCGLLMAACAGNPAAPEETGPVASRGFAWEVKDGEALLTGIGQVAEGDIWIPGQVHLVETTDGWTEAADDTSGAVYPVVVKGDAFKNCKQLVTVTFMDGVQIENNQMHGKKLGMFYKCSNLVAVYNIPDSVTSMQGTFEGCKALSEAPVLPSALVNMTSAFENCISLGEPSVIPDSVTEMTKAFLNCTSLERMPEIPQKVKNLTSSFQGCASLKETTDIPASVQIMNNTFAGCGSLTRTPVLPEGVEEIINCFAGCSSLIDAEPLPASIKKMNAAFKNCTALATAPDIPEGITELQSTFEGCSSLVNAPQIADSVTNLFRTFAGCESLVVPPEIHENVKEMEYTFERCTAMKVTPHLPDSIILNHAFKDCTSLQTVTNIPGSTGMIKMFENCTSLTEVLSVSPDAQITFGMDIFLNCDNLKTITTDFCLCHIVMSGTLYYLFAYDVEFIPMQDHSECKFRNDLLPFEYELFNGIHMIYENTSESQKEWFKKFLDEEVPDFFLECCNYLFFKNDILVPGGIVPNPNGDTTSMLNSFAGVRIKNTVSNSQIKRTVYHEFGHCFDAFYSIALDPGRLYMSLSNTETWKELHKQEGDICGQWYSSVYYMMHFEWQCSESFAISVSKYFTDPNALKSRCPGMYEYMDNLFRPLLEAEAAAKAETENAA